MLIRSDRFDISLSNASAMTPTGLSGRSPRSVVAEEIRLRGLGTDATALHERNLASAGAHRDRTKPTVCFGKHGAPQVVPHHSAPDGIAVLGRTIGP